MSEKGFRLKYVRNNLLKNNVTSEGVVSHNVLYCQQLSLGRNQVGFMLVHVYSLGNYQACPVPSNVAF